VIGLLAQEFKQTRFTVPGDFPAGVYEKLGELGLDLTVADGALFPAREIKTAAEAAAIREGNRLSALGFAAAEKILRASRVSGRRLLHRGRPVTSEMLKFAIEVAVLEAGGVSTNTIVAGGDQACDPHERGSGPLRPNELIIIDIFPRVTATGYHGDMTRTFLRGRANEAQRALVAAVRAAQLAALTAIRAGANGRLVHGKCVEEIGRAHV
jgi:Xaa-Pro aminopeptidase